MDSNSNHCTLDYGIGTYWEPNVRFVASVPGERISIGRFCSIADYVTIVTGGGHRTELVSTWPFDNLLLNKSNPTRSYKSTRSTSIGHDVWIGYGAHICGGVQVGSGAVIASKSVVFNDVPPYAVVAGNPAEVLRYRFSKNTVDKLLRLEWWNWSVEKIKDNIDWFYQPVLDFINHFESKEG